MRRFLWLIAVPVLACLVLAGCGSSKPAAPTDVNASVTATGSFGKTPTVTIPKAKASDTLTVKTLIQGTGPALTKSDFLAANFVVYFWDGTSSALKANTFTSNPAVIGSTMLPGLESALVGKKVGSRILAVIPPADGYGTSGNPQVGITGTTTLVYVIDMVKQYPDTAAASGTKESSGGGSLPAVTTKPGSAPTVTIPSSAPPSTLVAKTLIKGSGPKIAKGQFVIAQYAGYIWRTKKPFASSWAQGGSPEGFALGATPEQVIPGWDKGLAGQTVGSQVLLVIPPKDGYGSSGQPQAGIKGTDTLVFVVDIIDALPAPTS